ncbi:hypothetical protein TBLA_0H02930 [Henningerozyma blattae CBS 6284]|uniref:C3H1-type domain-containing protein n=1 Tax=Henningerozyma blattae (strain ATCC 34711 / CBS 6284 / DSM 70876 / NBRC 10599 / NRRL Y-10934 / UCD 77-7) TaxID=1071380 RepID=I2H875_HENB6|nr:hypothetical protein TBLA_0H02930 [Tetrapisispora blattae CBS 6284]CCH62577.1 hypothetical protein TBLA_0H02930 [Tetrapisispora blattae CBS 6284]
MGYKNKHHPQSSYARIHSRYQSGGYSNAGTRESLLRRIGALEESIDDILKEYETNYKETLHFLSNRDHSKYIQNIDPFKNNNDQPRNLDQSSTKIDVNKNTELSTKVPPQETHSGLPEKIEPRAATKENIISSTSIQKSSSESKPALKNVQSTILISNFEDNLTEIAKKSVNCSIDIPKTSQDNHIVSVVHSVSFPEPRKETNDKLNPISTHHSVPKTTPSDTTIENDLIATIQSDTKATLSAAPIVSVGLEIPSKDLNSSHLINKNLNQISQTDVPKIQSGLNLDVQERNAALNKTNEVVNQRMSHSIAVAETKCKNNSKPHSVSRTELSTNEALDCKTTTSINSPKEKVQNDKTNENFQNEPVKTQLTPENTKISSADNDKMNKILKLPVAQPPEQVISPIVKHGASITACDVNKASDDGTSLNKLTLNKNNEIKEIPLSNGKSKTTITKRESVICSDKVNTDQVSSNGNVTSSDLVLYNKPKNTDIVADHAMVIELASDRQVKQPSEFNDDKAKALGFPTAPCKSQTDLPKQRSSIQIDTVGNKLVIQTFDLQDDNETNKINDGDTSKNAATAVVLRETDISPHGDVSDATNSELSFLRHICNNYLNISHMLTTIKFKKLCCISSKKEKPIGLFGIANHGDTLQLLSLNSDQISAIGKHWDVFVSMLKAFNETEERLKKFLVWQGFVAGTTFPPGKLTTFYWMDTYYKHVYGSSIYKKVDGNESFIAPEKPFCKQFCKYGECNTKKCRFIHDKKNIALCKDYFFRGACYKDCNLTHQPRGNANVIPVCKYDFFGTCNYPFGAETGEYGPDYCKYVHNSKARKDYPNCMSFAYGSFCEDGLNCEFPHVWECFNEYMGIPCVFSGCTYSHSNKSLAEPGFTHKIPLNKIPDKAYLTKSKILSGHHTITPHYHSEQSSSGIKRSRGSNFHEDDNQIHKKPRSKTLEEKLDLPAKGPNNGTYRRNVGTTPTVRLDEEFIPL